MKPGPKKLIIILFPYQITNLRGSLGITKREGGVGFLIRTDILYRTRNDLISDAKSLACEQCYIEIKNNTEKVIIGTMYRPPSTNISEFINIFNTQIGKISKKGYECIIGLDHNLDLLKQSVHSKNPRILGMHPGP